MKGFLCRLHLILQDSLIDIQSVSLLNSARNLVRSANISLKKLDEVLLV